jgi:hypothetical protein
MRTHAFAVFIASLMLAASIVLPGSAWGQSNPARSPEPGPIGKVVTATGSVTIDHAGAVVVQANPPR